MQKISTDRKWSFVCKDK